MPNLNPQANACSWSPRRFLPKRNANCLGSVPATPIGHHAPETRLVIHIKCAKHSNVLGEQNDRTAKDQELGQKKHHAHAPIHQCWRQVRISTGGLFESPRCDPGDGRSQGCLPKGHGRDQCTSEQRLHSRFSGSTHERNTFCASSRSDITSNRRSLADQASGTSDNPLATALGDADPDTLS